MKKQLFAGIMAAFAAFAAFILLPFSAGVIVSAGVAWIALYFI